jgi:hypothetical protein
MKRAMAIGLAWTALVAISSGCTTTELSGGQKIDILRAEKLAQRGHPSVD